MNITVNEKWLKEREYMSNEQLGIHLRTTLKEAPIDKKSLDLEQRKIKFAGDVKIIGSQYSNAMLMEFCLYWSEHNPNGKKMKFEMQKVFDISRRLATWNKNQSKFGNDTNSEISIERAIEENINNHR